MNTEEFSTKSSLIGTGEGQVVSASRLSAPPPYGMGPAKVLNFWVTPSEGARVVSGSTFGFRSWSELSDGSVHEVTNNSLWRSSKPEYAPVAEATGVVTGMVGMLDGATQEEAAANADQTGDYQIKQLNITAKWKDACGIWHEDSAPLTTFIPSTQTGVDMVVCLDLAQGIYHDLFARETDSDPAMDSFLDGVRTLDSMGLDGGVGLVVYYNEVQLVPFRITPRTQLLLLLNRDRTDDDWLEVRESLGPSDGAISGSLNEALLAAWEELKTDRHIAGRVPVIAVVYAGMTFQSSSVEWTAALETATAIKNEGIEIAFMGIRLGSEETAKAQSMASPGRCYMMDSAHDITGVLGGLSQSFAMASGPYGETYVDYYGETYYGSSISEDFNLY